METFAVTRALIKVQIFEIIRSKILVWASVCATATLALAYFVKALALTESANVLTVTIAPLMRLTGVMLVALFCVQSICRDIQDRTHLNLLVQPISRGAWLFFKLVGCALNALCIAIPIGVVLLVIDGGNKLTWWFSLNLEFLLIAAVAGLLSITFGQVAISTFCTLLLYVAGRLTTIFTELALRGDETSWWEHFASGMVKVVDQILPKISIYAKTDWLIANPSDPILGVASLLDDFLQTTIYLAVIFLIGWIDLRKREW